MPLRGLKTGDKIRARVDHYPARAGATATVRYVMPTLLYAVVEWDNPEANLTPERISEVSVKDLGDFDVL